MRGMKGALRVETLGHVITLAAMAGTAAALASWIPIWWLGVLVALVVDASWWVAARYESRIRETGASTTLVTRLTWGIAALSAVLLVAHAVAERSIAWGVVAVLPLVSRLLGWISSLWEATEVTADALADIRAARQSARDTAAVARARLVAEADAERVRVETVTAVGARVAQVQAEAAARLSEAWAALEEARASKGTREALTCVTGGVTDGVTGGVAPRWEMPVLGSFSDVPAIAPAVEVPLSDAELDELVRDIRHSESPPLSYRDMAARFRAAGHSAGETRLRAAWRRVTAQQADSTA